MKSETKVCQNCKINFILVEGDFNFYEKIKVPAPSFCPDCRSQRRLCWRNERTLYKSNCYLCKKSIFSIYSSDNKYIHYCLSCWYSDKWDSMNFGRSYDFSKSFFEQFRDLMLDVPLPAIKISSSINCDFNNNMSNSKDCYLSFRVHRSDNILYTYRAKPSSHCVDCFGAFNSQYLFQCIESTNCNNGQYLYFCVNCADSKFLFNCRNCTDCFMCSNLRNKSYCINNQQLTREEYKKKISEIENGSYKETERHLELFKEIKEKAIRKNLLIVNSPNSLGDNLINCKNCYMCFDCALIEDSRYVMEILTPSSQIMDASSGGGSELVYETTGGARAVNVKFCDRPSNSRNVEYCFHLDSCSNLFGCVGLRNKEYCIFNKQYTREEYEELVPMIKKHMNDMPYIDNGGRVYKYGEFFPFELSPWAYNETVAQEIFPINKKIAVDMSYNWKEKNERDYRITILAEKLPDNIRDAKDDILNEIIGCIHRGKCYDNLEFCGADCTSAYRIVQAELNYYRRMNLPLPRLCPNCRHYKRLKEKNPNKLWHGRCGCNRGDSSGKAGINKNTTEHFHGKDSCPIEFETSYSPERKEIIYCEKCYQQEIY